MSYRAFLLTLLPAAPLLLAPVLYAQSFTPVREQKNLSPSALAKLHTLETLNALPAGDWRFHAGDIPHGEAVALDDSTWPVVTPKSTAPKEAVWYRRTIEVPKTLNGYDISGSRILFQFQADANGSVPEIVYFNGKRVALGEDLEPIVLFEPAKPGDRILVAVKLLHTIDVKTFTGVSLRVEPGTALGAAARPGPDDLRIQCITAANLLPALPAPRKDLLPTVEAAVAAIDTAALAAGNQPAFDASLLKAQAILAPLHAVLAEDKIDLAGNSHIDAAWLWPRSETIDVVKRTFTTALQLMNEYPDYTFTQSAAQYSEWMADKYPDLNAQIAQRIKEGRWEIVGGMWVEPDLNLPDGESLVRQLLVGQRYFQQQYGVTARIGWNPDSFGYNWQLPQIYKRSGLDYFVTQKMHWNDTNVLPFRLFWWQSPDGSRVLTYFPTDYVHDNVNPTRLSADFAQSAERNPGTTEHLDLYGIGDHGGGPTRDMLDQADHWIAASKQPGTAVPTIRYSTAQNFFTNVETHLNPDTPVWNYDSIARGYTPPPSAPLTTQALTGPGQAPTGPGQVPTSPGQAVTGPGDNQVPQGFSLGSHSGDKKEGVSTPGLIGLPTWKDELYFEYHRGIFTTQAKHKRYNRVSETLTLDAEKLASLAWLSGAAYPADILTENWKKIGFNQFHDLAAGSGIAVIYRDAQKDYYDVFNEDNLISQAAMKTVDQHINTTVKSGVPLIVYNTLAWPRVEDLQLTIQLPDVATNVKVFDAQNTEILAQTLTRDLSTHQFTVLAHVDVPALGYTVLHAAAANIPRATDEAPPTDLAATQDPATITLTNSHLKLVLDKKTGCITSLLSHDARGEILAPNACGNQLQTYADNPKQYDAWNIDPGTLDGIMTPITELDSIGLTEDGPLRKTVHLARTWQSSRFLQDISLDAYSDTVTVSNDVQWHESHVLLKAAFPLAATSPKATYEIPYGSIQRPTTRNNSWEKAQFEVPALRWADLGDTHQALSLLNDSKYGYDALGNTLRLTLLRSPTWPDPDADRGPQHFVYALYPHAGPWQDALTVHHGYELNTPLTAQQVFAHTGALPATQSFVSVDEPNIILTAVKKAEDAHALIFRFYEDAGTASSATLHIPAGASYAVETNLMETSIPNRDHLAVTGDTVTLPTKPYEIRTLEVVYPSPTQR